MAIRTVYLVSARNTPWQRAHFSIFVPSAGTANPALGTIIHVVGAPMAGYSLEFKRNYAPELSNEPHTMVPIGSVDESNIVDHASADTTIYSTPRGNLEIAASRIPPPRISQNFMAPVNDVSEIDLLFCHMFSNSKVLSRLPIEDARNGQRNMFAALWNLAISVLVRLI